MLEPLQRVNERELVGSKHVADPETGCFESEIKDDLKPSMMRCRSFLLVLSSASTRSSDSWDSIKAQCPKNEPSICRHYLAYNISSAFQIVENGYNLKHGPNNLKPKHFIYLNGCPEMSI